MGKLTITADATKAVEYLESRPAFVYDLKKGNYALKGTP